MRELFRRLLTLIAIGALLGAIVASLVAPRFLTWYNTPAQGQALCDCASVTQAVAGQLIRAQLSGALVGALLVSVIGTIWRSKRNAKVTPNTPPQAS